mmetsp:Transcript_10743/g.25675  ORF Transcript_10743/g.25675 Transcript_10743/m.25675 type:complete len:533 (+) Transcript_10743:41-1639(+)
MEMEMRAASVRCCLGGDGGELGGLALDLLDVADHVEGRLGEVVVLAVDQARERRDALVERHELARGAGEDLSDVEGLAHELLDLAGAGDRDLVVLTQLVHSEDGNDILQVLVILEHLLHLTRELVVLLADDARVEHARCRVERVHGGVDSKLSNAARKHSRRVQMRKGGGGRRIGQIVSGHVDGLHGGDGTLLVGGDTLLEHTQIGGEGGLVSDSGRDTAEKGRHLGVGLGEAEDVVDEEKHVLALLVTEVLGNSETGQGNASAGTGRLVHLTVHERGLGAGGVELDHTRLDHLVVQLVTLAGALTDTSEHRVTSVRLGDVVDELHDENSLADTGTAEEANLASLGVGRKQINNLDASDKDLSLGRLLGESGRLSMDRHLSLGVDGATLVDGLADHVDNAAEKLGAGRHHDGGTGINNGLSTHKTLGGVHSNGTHCVLSKMLRDLEHQADGVLLHLKRVEDGGKLSIELHVNNGTNDLRDLSGGNAARHHALLLESGGGQKGASGSGRGGRRPFCGKARSDAGQGAETGPPS